MEFLVVVFRARTQTLTFANLLKSYGVNASIINTPRVINVSCGISVRINIYDKGVAQGIILRRRFDSYAGIYRVKQAGNQIILLGKE